MSLLVSLLPVWLGFASDGWGVVVVVVTVVVTVVVVVMHKLAPRSSKARKREAGPRG